MPHRSSLRSLISLSWPIFIAQLAVIANGVTDTIMVGHYHVEHLAAIGIAASINVTIYISLVGILQALAPIVAHNFGAQRYQEIGHDARQCIWLALFLSALGIVLMCFPGPMLQLTAAPTEVDKLVRSYLRHIAWGLPGALLARVFYAFTSAVGRTKPIMFINLVALCLKIPLSYVLLRGLYGFPELGVAGCAIGSVVSATCMAILSAYLAFRDPSYQPYRLVKRFEWPQWLRLKEILRLGLPIGISLFVETTAYTFMALFLAKLGAQTSAGHQIAANLGALLYMLPLALANGTSVLVAQALGKNDTKAARAAGWLGLRTACLLAVVVTFLVIAFRSYIIDIYTNDAAAADIAYKLIAIVAIYHIFDAMQVVLTFTLRGYKRTKMPMIIYVTALWGIGLGGGYALAFGNIYQGLQPLGATGFWSCSVLSLVLVCVLLSWYFNRISRKATSNEG